VSGINLKSHSQGLEGWKAGMLESSTASDFSGFLAFELSAMSYELFA
jgi:hypothetical protein